MIAQARAVNVTTTATVYSGGCTYRGLSIGSTAGAAVVVYDGTSAAGTVLASFTLAAAGFQHIDIPAGVRCDTGIHITCSAAVQGHVRVG
jgi:hypothetical protein